MDPLGEWSLKLVQSGFWESSVYGIALLWSALCCFAGCVAIARQFAKSKTGKISVFTLSFFACFTAVFLSTARPPEIVRAYAISDLQTLIHYWQTGQREKMENWFSNPPSFYK